MSRLREEYAENELKFFGGIGDFGGPCPCCGGKVEGQVCESCGWDEHGGNVFYAHGEEKWIRRVKGNHRKPRTGT